MTRIKRQLVEVRGVVDGGPPSASSASAKESELVNDDQVREKLREAFRTFSLPRTLPSPHLNGDEAITINGGRGRLCSVCGEIIPGDAEGSLAFQYPDNRVLTFHERCEQLWQEERHEVRRPGPDR